jgi:uncharacterized protein YdaU (DUF1376 family)
MSVNDNWMPLYLGDYLADTMHLNAAQHGSYLLLLMHYWRNGPLPDDDGQLAAIARCEMRLWKSVGPVIRAFFRIDGGVLRQKRMDQERTRWSSISDKRRGAGKAGAEAKWRANGSQPPPDPNPSRVANASADPVDNSGKRMANAITEPVDKYGKRIANAIFLPEKKWQTDGKCHDFAITPVPSKIYNTLSFKEVIPREEPTDAEIATARRAEHTALADAGEIGEIAAALGRKLNKIAPLPGVAPTRTADEQIGQLAGKPVVKPAYLSPEHLALLRARTAPAARSKVYA